MGQPVGGFSHRDVHGSASHLTSGLGDAVHSTAYGGQPDANTGEGVANSPHPNYGTPQKPQRVESSDAKVYREQNEARQAQEADRERNHEIHNLSETENMARINASGSGGNPEMAANDVDYDVSRDRASGSYAQSAASGRVQDTDALLAKQQRLPQGTEFDANMAAIPGTGSSNMAPEKTNPNR